MNSLSQHSTRSHLSISPVFPDDTLGVFSRYTHGVSPMLCHPVSESLTTHCLSLADGDGTHMTTIKSLSLAVYLVMVTIAQSASAKDLVLAANFWEPFTGQELSEHGFASQLVKTVLQSKGYKADIIIMPWARILHLLKSGNEKIDGVVAIWHTTEREKYVLLSHAYYRNQLCLVKHRDSPFEFSSINDFTGKLIGVGRNYEYSDELKNATHFQRAAQREKLAELNKAWDIPQVDKH